MQGQAKDFNVVFIISDQHQRDVTGCYGDPRVQTPNIDKLAAQGVRFTNAYCPSPLCGPSRSAVMTGTYPHTCNGFGHGKASVLANLPTLGSVFADAGYVTASIGKVHIQGEDKVERDFGFHERALRYYTYGFQDYIDAVGKENVDRYWSRSKHSTFRSKGSLNPTNEPITIDESLMFDALVVDRSIEFMEKHKHDRFFLWMGLEKPHPEWYAPAEFHALYEPDDMRVPETFHDEWQNMPRIVSESNFDAKHYPEGQVRTHMAAYYANVSYLDHKVGQALAAIAHLDLRENTIIVYSTDHGENLFQHGLVQKHCFYEAAVAVPLLIACPGILPAGTTCTGLASLIDLFPTWLDLVDIPRPASLEGQSLLPAMEGNPDAADRAIFAEFYSKGAAERMIRTPAYKYVYTHDDLPQLYDVDDDPLERTNLVGQEDHEEEQAALHAQLMADWDIDLDQDWKDYA